MLKKLEFVLLLFFVTTLLFSFYGFEQARISLIVSLGALASYYMLMGFAYGEKETKHSLLHVFDANNPSQFENIFIIIMHLSLVQCIIGALFKIQFWPGYKTLFFVGGPSILIASLGYFVLQMRKEVKNNEITLRGVVGFAFVCSIYFMPMKVLAEWKGITNPEQIQLMEQLEKKPNDREARKQLDSLKVVK